MLVPSSIARFLLKVRNIMFVSGAIMSIVFTIGCDDTIQGNITVSQLLDLTVSPATVIVSNTAPVTFLVTNPVGSVSSLFTNCSICQLETDQSFIAPWFAGTGINLTFSDSQGRSADSLITLNPRAVLYGDSGDDRGYAVEVAPDGSIYVFGRTTSSLGDQVNQGGTDIFLAKFNKYGAFVWVRMFGTAAFDTVETHRFVFDDTGNIVVVGFTTGSFPGYTNLGGGWSGYDLVIIKVEPDGDTMWLRQYPIIHDTIAYHIVRNDDHFFISGWTKAVLMDASTVGDPSGYVAKFDFDGNMLDVAMLGHSSGGSLPRGLTVSSSGVYVAGSTNGSLPGFTNQGNYDVFAIKLDLDLNIQWRYQFGGPVSDTQSGAVVVDDVEGAVYISGATAGSLGSLPSAGGEDLFIAKLDSGDGSEIWFQQVGTTGNDKSSGIAFDQDKDPVVFGRTTGAFPTFTNLGSSDLMMLKFSKVTGVITDSHQWGSAQAEESFGIIENSGFFFVTGWTAGTFEHALNANSNVGTNDLYISKFNQDLEIQ